jgi:hypothetical protein
MHARSMGCDISVNWDSLMWVIAGLTCTALACVWEVPAFTWNKFESETECREVVAHIGPMDTAYFVLECRRTNQGSN